MEFPSGHVAGQHTLLSAFADGHTDWNTVWNALADDPRARVSLNVASLNFYQPSADDPEFRKTLAWHLDMHRPAYGLGHFLVT